MPVSPSAHLPTTPNEHPAAAGHLGDRAEAAGTANEAVQPPDIAAELVCFSGIENNQPSADHSSTQTHPVVLPNPPNRRPVAASHLCDRIEAAAAASGAYLPPDTASEAATTLPPPPPSPETITACPSISNCNAEEGDERGTTERDPNTPSASKATKKDTTEVSCVPFYHSN